TSKSRLERNIGLLSQYPAASEALRLVVFLSETELPSLSCIWTWSAVMAGRACVTSLISVSVCVNSWVELFGSHTLIPTVQGPEPLVGMKVNRSMLGDSAGSAQR